MFSNPLTDKNWPRKTVAFIDKWIGLVRDQTTSRLANIIRGLVFGVIICVVVVITIIIGLIGLARATHELLDIWLSRSMAVWVSYLALSFLFLVTGGVLMRKRHANKQ